MTARAQYDTPRKTMQPINAAYPQGSNVTKKSRQPAGIFKCFILNALYSELEKLQAYFFLGL